MKKLLATVAAAAALLTPVLAHHGGTSVSQGPGTPIETNTPLTLPKGGTVIFTRAELAKFRKFSTFEPENVDSFNFFQLGVSHGLSDFLTATAIVPYNIKSQDNVGTTRGIGDLKFLLTLGMNYSAEEGLQLNGEEDTAVNLGESNKTYFGITGGFSVPTGRSDVDFGGGVDGGLQSGFGVPSATLGVSMTKGLSEKFTIAADTGFDWYATQDGGNRFATEFRANVAGVYELYADQESTFRRLDGILELNYLNLARDVSAYLPEQGTGGQILYITPGLRTQIGDYNLGAAVKIPIASALNERSMQQGSEGLEQYRLIITASTYF